MPHFSVIIPTYERNDLLARCLKRLAPGAQSLSADRYEVLVADDGGKNNARDLIKTSYPWVQWIAGPHRGPAANRNAGTAKASGEWLAYTDDDCIPDREWLAGFAAAIDALPGCRVFEGRIYADRPRRSLAETSPLNETGGHLWSCNFAVNATIFREVGGFDERYPYAAMEDMDLALRLKQRGWQPEFLPGASVCHPWRPIKGWTAFQQQEKAMLIYLRLHPDESRRLTARFYLGCFFRSLLKDVLIGGLRCKGAGLRMAALQGLAQLRLAFLVRAVEPVADGAQASIP